MPAAQSKVPLSELSQRVTNALTVDPHLGAVLPRAVFGQLAAEMRRYGCAKKAQQNAVQLVALAAELQEKVPDGAQMALAQIAILVGILLGKVQQVQDALKNEEPDRLKKALAVIGIDSCAKFHPEQEDNSEGLSLLELRKTE